MKKNSKKKPTESKAPANPPPVAEPPSTLVQPIESVQYGPPPPEILLHEAEQEGDQAVLRQYAQVIHVLRGKHFSYREIADWLNERGVKTDRNEVYRIYSKILPPEVEAQESQEADEEKRAGV